MAAPTISAFSPVDGTFIQGNTPIAFTITENAVALVAGLIYVNLPGTAEWEVVWDLASGFSPLYQPTSSVSISGASPNRTFSFSMLRSPVWNDSPTFSVIAVDTAGDLSRVH